MLYLIGGPPRCGKTSAARRLAAAIGCGHVAADWLSVAIGEYIHPTDLRPEERIFDLGPDVPANSFNDVLYARYPAAAIVAYYRAWAQRLWPGVQSFLSFALNDGADLVVEGYELDPTLLSTWRAALPPEQTTQVHPIMLYRGDVDDIIASLKLGKDWVVTNTQEAVTFERIARMIAVYSAAIQTDATALAIPAFNMDFQFEAQLERVVELLRT